MMGKLGMLAQEPLKRGNELQVILARLQIGYTKDKRHAQMGLQGAPGNFAGDRTKFRGNAVGNHHHLMFRQTVSAENAFLGELAGRQDPRRAADGALHREPKLHSAKARKVLGMLQKTHVVYGGYHRYTAK